MKMLSEVLTEVNRTEQIWLNANKELSKLCHIAKNLYNKAIYIIRQEFFKTGKWISYSQLCYLLKNSENFKQLPAATAQQILILVERNWKAFFKAMKEYRKHPEKFKNKPALPGYKPKDGEFMLLFTNQQIKVVSNKVEFSKKIDIEVKTRLSDDTSLGTSSIIPKGVGFILNIVYKKTIKPVIETTKNILGIDMGLNNLVTTADNIGKMPIIIKGGIVKSINHFYNKRKAEIQSKYDLSGIKKQTKQLSRLLVKRDFKIKDFFHKASRKIIAVCKTNSIDTIVIGHNNDWKQKIDIGKKNNQNFVSIPFNKLIEMLKYKAEEEGIKTIIVNEAHTSKCSFLDDETIKHHDRYLGKRICRGLFKTLSGKIINADVNHLTSFGDLKILKGFLNGAY
ncbi:MAG: transposase, partial [Candidatus Altiarchaeales archaeon HGW-Altiarchaeales-1]